MSISIVRYTDPYKLDTITLTWGNQSKTIPALTEKNAKFISAVIGLDSNYGRDSDESFIPASGYVPGENGVKDKRGSSAYWFNKLITDHNLDNYKNNLLGAIICVDAINSTHLEASDNGRQIARDRILEVAPTPDDLKNKIEESYIDQCKDDKSIFYKLCEKMGAVKEGERYNISFATKFCFFGAKYMHVENDFSIYDNVVSDAMVWYCKAYLGKKLHKKDFKVENENSLEGKLEIFQFYIEKIDEILQEVEKTEHTTLTKEQFDNIIWYGLK